MPYPKSANDMDFSSRRWKMCRNVDYRSYTFLVLINKRFHQRSAINYMDFVHWLGPRHIFTPPRSHSKLLLSYFATELRLTSKLVRTQSANNGHLITLINTTFQKNVIITSISNYNEEIAYADIQNFQPVQRTAN
jgi:hypothetical protein